MFTTTGNVGDGRYYVRINANGTPDDGLDGGFLELVRLGVNAQNDPYVATSIPKLA